MMQSFYPTGITFLQVKLLFEQEHNLLKGRHCYEICIPDTAQPSTQPLAAHAPLSVPGYFSTYLFFYLLFDRKV